MSTKIKKIVSLVLSLTLMFSLCVPAYAANETNTLGVTFDVTLDNPALTQSASDQTVVMTLKANQGISVDGFSGNVVVDSPITIAAISTADENIPVDAAGTNVATGAFYGTTADMENATGVTELIKVTLTVPANTTGTYNVGVQGLELTSDYGTVWESAATASTTLTIEEAAAPTDGYAAGISTINNPVAVDQAVNVVVNAQHSEDTQYAAAEIVLTYDSTLLTFNEGASVLGAATVKDNAGTLTLEDYGEFKNLGDVYTVAFTAKTAGNAAVTLTSAKFIDKENAVAQDLIDATISPATINVTVNEKTFDVTLPDIFAGDSVVTNGQDYTFTVTDGDNYTYTDVKATIDGVEVEVIDNGDGTYTVKNVTGELVITATRTEKSYTVTFEGEGAEDAEALEGQPTTATYNTDLEFTLPTADNYAYAVAKVTIGGTEYTGYSVENDVVTIAGTAITGDIVIEISKTQTEATVKVEGTGAGAAAGYETSATIGESYTLTITPETGYIYTVTATMGGGDVELVEDTDANTYTIETVSGDIVFTVNRKVVVEGVTLSEYLTVDGSKMWLVINEATLDEGKTSTYNGVNMFWSDSYGEAGAYCYLVVADELTIDEAKANIGIYDGTATKLAGGMDVNKTGVIDAADAQLVHNMYNAYYNGFTTDATMEKFLEADVNADTLVDVKDATAIINELLK
ncbi:MAG: hypothetical protein IJ410_00615 [Oscillospiraceae bacterium]|nr:hypothetical protein [Oscillospiraceae bacterium]